jgi:GNAT superfamily N-acetyltransferase
MRLGNEGRARSRRVTDNIEIFVPGEANLREVAAVHVASWRTTYAGIVPDTHLASLSVDRYHERHRQLVIQQGVRCLAARDNSLGRIIGLANGGPSRDADAQASAGELYAMYLLESHQRRGIGTALLRRLAEQLAADGFRSCSAWVLADNPSRAFYERLGGQPNGSQTITIGGEALVEFRYVWPEIHCLQTCVS